MDMFDSRAMRYIDCYLQKFSKPGTVRYKLTTAAGRCLPIDKENAFTIKILERGGRPTRESQQLNISIIRKGNRLTAEPESLEIFVGDAILWHTTDPSITSWMVEGEGDGVSFSSSAITSEAVYSHAFGTPGEYKWVDANLGRLSGTVIVQSLDSQNPEDCRKWIEALDKGSVVLINGDSVRPSKVEILTGQTVLWAVQKAEGISITDDRLIPYSHSDSDQV